MIKLKDLLLEAPAQPAPAPAKPERSTEPDVAPGRPAKPQPRRRSVPSPETSPTPAPKAEKQQGKKEPAHQAPKDKDKQGPSSVNEESDVMKKIVDRYMKAFNKLSEAEYEKIFDPETLGKLKGSVAQRLQGKNPMQIAGTMQQLAMQVMQLEKGNEDLLSL
jgi:outer membrane biosynthesis protein TonB